MVVDAFCREPQLNEIARYTETTRVLVGPRVAEEPFDLTLDAVREPRQIEVRVSEEIHDRNVIPDTGPVLAFGTSLGGVGRDKPSILVSLTPAMSAAVRETYERLWESASVWAPSAGDTGSVDHGGDS